MNELKKQARLAGLWYLVMGITGVVGLMYFPGKFLFPDDLTRSMQEIAAHPEILRWSVLANLLCQTSFLFTALALKKLFEKTDKGLTDMLWTLVTAAVPVAFLVALLPFGALYFAQQYADNALLMNVGEVFLDLNQQGIYVVEIFWGLWLIPFGLLFIKAPFMPNLVGYLLLAGGICYCIESVTQVLGFSMGPIASTILAIFLVLGEFSAIFFLIIKGHNGKVPIQEQLGN